MTPLERAARALIDLSPTVSGYHQDHIDMMMPKVRAVLQAIREPSEAMVKAYANGIPNDLVLDPDGYHLQEEGWAAAIDTALEEG